MRYVRYGAAKCGSGQKNGRRAVFDGLLCALCVTVGAKFKILFDSL